MNEEIMYSINSILLVTILFIAILLFYELGFRSMLQNDDHMSYVPTIMGNGAEYTEEMIQLRMDMLEEIKHSIVEVSRLLSLLTYENDL